MKIVREFREFISRGNVIDLAVAVVIGAAFSKIVDAIVTGVIMPLVGGILPGKSWDGWVVTPLHLQIGLVLAAIVNFLIIAFCVFIVVKKVMGSFAIMSSKPAAGPVMKDCPECLEKIPIAARRCRACTSPV